MLRCRRGIASSRSRGSANGPGRGGRTFPICLTTGRQPRAFRTQSRSTCRFSIPASVGQRRVNLSVLAGLRYWVHLFGSAASTDEDTVNRSAFPQEIAFATTGIVTGSERSTQYRNPAKADTARHHQTRSIGQRVGYRTKHEVIERKACLNRTPVLVQPEGYSTGPSHPSAHPNGAVAPARPAGRRSSGRIARRGRHSDPPAAAICQHV